MSDKQQYPQTVCIECLTKAYLYTQRQTGTRKQTNLSSGVFSVYTATCDICGETKKCTEPRDAGYPDFSSLRREIKIKKLLEVHKRI